MVWWNPFLTFCSLVLLGGVLLGLFTVWLSYASRPPRCKCKCANR